jgi:hypothetical protein
MTEIDQMEALLRKGGGRTIVSGLPRVPGALSS